MPTPIDKQHGQLRQLCRRFDVQRLELFGSAADGSYEAGRSDLDFLVQFLPMSAAEHYEAYFGLLEALEDLFHQRVDLVEARALRNPFVIRRVNETRTELYAA